MKKFLPLLLILPTLAFSEVLDRTGPYIALGGGYATLYDDGRMQAQSHTDSYNVNLIGGAFINKYFSVELGVDYFDTFSNNINTNTTNLYMIDAAAKAHYTFWKDRIDLYCAFGAGGVFWKDTINANENKNNSSELRGDLGIGFRILKDLTLNLGYRRYYFTLDQETDQRDEYGNIEYIRYNMTLGSAYTNLEVQF